MSKIVAITGGSKGIGRAIALQFASNGFSIAVCARNNGDLLQLKAEVKAVSALDNHLFVQADVTGREALESFSSAILEQFGKADVVVNNAGVFLSGEIISEEEGVLEKLIETNLYSAYHFTRALLPTMIKNKEGSIFNICSIASLQAYPNGGSYTISKFAMLGFSKALREELKEHRIKVTSVMPGATLTASWKGTDLPESRFIPAEDVAKLIYDVYSLSPSADVEEIVIRPIEGDI